MLTFLQAIVLGLLQGVTELFPISSLGHSILIPGLLGWHLNMEAAAMLEFLVATHFATALVLFLIYWKDWMRIIGAFFRSLGNWKLVSAPVAPSMNGAAVSGGGDIYAKLAWLLIIGTIPAGIVGFAFQKKLEALFIDPRAAATFLIVNGALLFAAEMTRRRIQKRRGAEMIAETPNEISGGGDARIAKLGWWAALKVGVIQILALIPGISRTGSTFAGGLWEGLSHEDSLRFSFLLATPIIGGAALLELPKLAHAGGSLIGLSLAGALAAAVGAYFSAKILVRWFKTRTLLPFAAYCAAIGIIGLIVLR